MRASAKPQFIREERVSLRDERGPGGIFVNRGKACSLVLKEKRGARQGHLTKKLFEGRRIHETALCPLSVQTSLQFKRCVFPDVTLEDFTIVAH
jgi:hypothetical protein